MTITSPLIITPRLLPGVRIGNAFVSITYSKRAGDDSRTRYRWFVDLPDGSEHVGDDLQSGCHGGSLQDGLESLLCFLSACGESVQYAEHTGREGENADIFPPAVAQWCADNRDELGMLKCELQETQDLIEE